VMGGRRITIPRLIPDFARYPLAVFNIRTLLTRFRPDIVNAHFIPNYGVIAALTGFSPWVLSTWGSDVMLLPQKSPFHMWRTRLVIARADAITSDADVMSRRLVELGAQPDRVVTFPYGVDRAAFFPASAPPADGEPRILCNRKMEAIYNVSTLVDAFAEVSKSLTDAHLTLAGDGAMRRSLEKKAVESGAGSLIRFVGEVPHAEMPDLLRRHELFVSVALSDTTSVSLLEAMACGLFPIVSDIAANREWIEHGVNGFVVSARDSTALARAIVAAWIDRDLREAAKRRNADLIASRADWFRNMSVVDDLFRRLARK
jgi:glycosyltransferase involved in cell wall biosynthesis